MQSFIYEIAEVVNWLFGYKFTTILPVVFLFFLVIWQVRVFTLNLPIIAVSLALMPALTPFLADLSGYQYFTFHNHDIQADGVLKVAAILLIVTFCISFVFGAVITNKVSSGVNSRRHVLGYTPLLTLMIINFVLIIMFLESGSILSQSYGDIKHDNAAPYSSLVNQFFNGCLAAFLCHVSSKSRKRLIAIFLVIMIITMLLLSRRTLAISLIILSVYLFGLKGFSVKQILFLLLGIALLIFIGEARTVGISEYLQGGESIVGKKMYYSLPGGASNIFIASMGVIDLIGREILGFPETLPILLWPSGVYESSIYGGLDYSYNGGMHIANVLYWNFGILGVIFGGIFLGWITKRVHIISLRVQGDLRGTLAAMLSFGFILTLPSLIWYNPIGTIKLSITITLIFYLLMIIIKPSSSLN